MRLLLLIVVLSFPCITFGNIAITEVLCNPTGSDADGEWVKIKNTGSETVDITGWKFNDGSNHNLNIPPENGGVGSMQIASGESVLLANKASKVTGASTIIDTVMSLSNSGDTLKIIDNNGTEVHTITYTASDVVEGASCFSYDTEATTTTGSSNTEIQKNIITTVNEVTRYRTVEIQPPQDILIRTIPNKTILVGSSMYISPEVYDATGKSISPKCQITFGDGQVSNTCSTQHVYEFSGTYIVAITAKKNSLKGNSKFSVTVVEPELKIFVDSNYTYVEIMNNANTNARLNGWVLKVDYKKFTIPDNTIISANGSIKIGAHTINIDIARHGGTVHLLNTFGDAIADSSEYKREVIEPLIEVVPNPVEEIPLVVEKVEAIEEKEEVIIMNPPKQRVHVGIIGAPAPEVKSQQIAEEATLEKSSSYGNNNIQQIASVGSVDTSAVSPSFSNILSQEQGKWLVGLLALLGIALMPVLMSKRGDELVDVARTHNDEEVEKFTIEELK